MERLENRHNLDAQAAVSEEIATDNMLSLADLHKRNLERTIANNVDIAHTARSQKLPPEKLIKFLIAAEGGPLAKELHRAGIDATPAAVSQRRRQIPPAVFRKVFLDFTSSSAYGQPNRGYKGCRVLACDGTAVNMARNPNAPSYVCNNSAPKGYNQLHLNPLFDIYDRTYFVWKLDRFARNRYDSARYKATLKKNGVKVVSATEVISDGAEGIIFGDFY